MTYNRYTQYARNAPGNQRQFRVGEPIWTKFGQGIIMEIKYANGGLYPEQSYNPPAAVLSILFANQKMPIDIPISSIVYQSDGGFGGAQEVSSL